MTTFISLPDQQATQPQHSAGVTAGDLTFLTVTALDPATGRRAAAAATMADEVALLFSRADAVLAEAGLTREDLVKSVCWVSDESQRFDFIYAYRDQCAEGVYPQRITMSAGLPADCRCAIEFIAAKR